MTALQTYSIFTNSIWIPRHEYQLRWENNKDIIAKKKKKISQKNLQGSTHRRNSCNDNNNTVSRDAISNGTMITCQLPQSLSDLMEILVVNSISKGKSWDQT